MLGELLVRLSRIWQPTCDRSFLFSIPPARCRDDRRGKVEALESRCLLAAGLTGEYFNEINLTGLAGTRIDPVINFPQDWGAAPPGTAVIADDNYSGRWTGYVLIDQPGAWTLYTTSNDGVRLWVDDVQIINNWNQHTIIEDTATRNLSAGWHPIRLEYFQQNGTAEITLSFSGPGQSKTIIPSTHLSTEIASSGGPPTANAGPDQFVLLPEDHVTLHGGGTDEGVIAAYEWVQLNGPNDATLSGATTPSLTASNLVEGLYTFRLSVTDDDGNSDTDTATVAVAPQSGGGTGGTVSGELKEWHKVTITFDGPQTSETANPNPFTAYRLDVTFTHSGTGKTFRVPGYYAADGNAANTGATSGNQWRVHFAPGATGPWTWTASFRTGDDVAVAMSPNAGSSAGYFDGAAGSFTIASTDKSGRDFRGQGLLEYVGGRYLQFAETGEYFLKQGADAPENLLAYADFDGPFASDGQNDQYIKDWQPHVQDWNSGDPTWDGGKGKGLIGAVNYLASEGQNAFSFIPLNIGGDDRNVFPYLNYNERLRMDVSRLDQWEIVFEHADHQGMFLHFKTQETENELLLDGGNMGPQRTLYYRELIARFSHHLAMNWNLGEEINNASTAQKQAWAQFFHDNDPYRHHIVIHNGASHTDLVGGNSELTGFSLQTFLADFSDVHSRVLDYIDLSVTAGKPWAVANDEAGSAEHGIRPDNDAGNSHEDGRKHGLWGTLMAGGWGNEWYFGYAHAHSDLTLNDFRSRDAWWDSTRYALQFFNNNDIPFWQMHNDNAVSSASNDYGFVKNGEVYVVYLKNGGTTNLNLNGASGTFDVRWFDPRHGGPLQVGTVQEVQGGGSVSLGQPPNNTSQDWAILVTRPGGSTNDPPVARANRISTPEDIAYAFQVGDFPFTDAEGDALVSVTITHLNLAGGLLQHGGDTEVGNGTTLTAAQLATLVYTPPANATGSPLATFEFTVNDADPGLVAAELAIDVTPANDPPPPDEPPPNEEVLIFSDSFEVGTWNGLWVEDSQNDWFRSTQRATDGNDSAEVDGSANNATLTTADAFDLSRFAAATLTFSWYIESGFDSDEYLAFDISVDGGSTWQNILSLNGNQDQENAWHHETVDLRPYLSSNFRFRFRADVSSSSEDANVDNVRLVAGG